MDKINILGLNVDFLDMEQSLEKTMNFLKKDKPHVIYTPNSEIVMCAYRDEKFRHTLNTADLIVADGIGLVYASKILGAPLKERVGGLDLANRLLEKIKDGSHSLYLFGGKPGVADLADKRLHEKYPHLNIVGTSNGYFDSEREQEIIADIKAKKPDILFVCLGAPKQENWILEHKNELGVKLLMGIGGSLDIYAGIVNRAPMSFQKLGLEWLYRLIKEPKRFFRMLDLPRFAFTVIFKGKRVEKV